MTWKEISRCKHCGHSKTAHYYKGPGIQRGLTDTRCITRECNCKQWKEDEQ